MSSEALMLIKRGSQTRKRNFYNLRKYDGNLTKSIIKFYLPAKVKGTSLLTQSYESKRKRDQWIYFPALKSLNKIGGNQEKESFMGSDYTYLDIAGRQLNQDKHTLVKQDEKYYYIKSIPQDKTDPYVQINLLVLKKPVPIIFKAIFFNSKGKFKTLEYDITSLKKLGPMCLFSRSIMKNHKTQGTTELQVSDLKRNISLSDRALSIKALKK